MPEPKYHELVAALRFCRDRLEALQVTMSEYEGLHDGGKLVPWHRIDEPMMVEAGVEVANRVLDGGTFTLATHTFYVVDEQKRKEELSK